MAFLLFILGTIMGSFYLVVGSRLPIGEDIIKSRSRCDYCKHTLKWYNLIPLLSYIFQRGKCTFCGEKIKEDHFFVELACGLMFMATYLYFPIGYNFYMGLIISSLLILIFVSDLKYMVILDSPLVIATILTIILKFIYFDYRNVISAILSGVMIILVMLLIQKIGNFIFKKDSLGGGDIKLSFVIGLMVDLQLGLLVLILSTFLALPYALTTMHFNKSSEFPYGPFLAGALLIVFYNYDKFRMLFEFLFPF